MSNTKKQYQELVAFLELNKNKKISTILDEVKAMCEAKKGGSNGETLKRDADGNVLEVYCWYHKEWEVVADVEYGTKKGTASGLNTMCKQGVSSWTKQQRVAKKQKDEVLDKLMNNELTQEDAKLALEAIEEARNVVVERT